MGGVQSCDPTDPKHSTQGCLQQIEEDHPLFKQTIEDLLQNKIKTAELDAVKLLKSLILKDDGSPTEATNKVVQDTLKTTKAISRTELETQYLPAEAMTTLYTEILDKHKDALDKIQELSTAVQESCVLKKVGTHSLGSRVDDLNASISTLKAMGDELLSTCTPLNSTQQKASDEVKNIIHCTDEQCTLAHDLHVGARLLSSQLHSENVAALKVNGECQIKQSNLDLSDTSMKGDECKIIQDDCSISCGAGSLSFERVSRCATPEDGQWVIGLQAKGGELQCSE